ncbi:hypothetical protein [Nocardioides sp. LHG3406-4]|uniref:hypothetical protein n=1 Tax=Nocardioides sp. LHG3406-4 TaxID=2804575 RepID=UPI003CEA1C62
MGDEQAAQWVRLRSGVPVVRRDAGHLQVGAHPDASLVVAATPAHAELFARLVRGLDPSSLGPGPARLVARLASAGLVVSPGERDRRLLRRSATLVEIAGPAAWQDGLAARLAEVGIRSVPAAERHVDAGLAVVLSAGEPDRDLADRCLHDDRTTLFVAAVDGRIRLGPWVVPGRTACLHCLDAHARDRDSRHPVLVEQWTASEAVAEVEPSLVSLALAWACADVVRWCHADQPTTWSSTIWLEEDALPVARGWTRHPWCGCCWAGLEVTG